MGSRLFVGLLAASAVLSPLAARAASLFATDFEPSGKSIISKIDPTGAATTFATANLGFSNLRVDGSGNLFVLDGAIQNNQQKQIISKIDTSGTVSTVATAKNGFRDLAIDKNGNVFATDFDVSINKGIITKIDPTGTETTFATAQEQNGLFGQLEFDGSGNLLVTEAGFFVGGIIKKFDSTGTGTVLATVNNADTSFDLVVDSSDNAFGGASDPFNTASISKISPTGAVTTFATPLSDLLDLAVDGSGNLFVSGFSRSIGNNTGSIIKIDPAGAVTTFATAQAQGNQFGGLALDESGNLFAIESGPQFVTRISKIDATGTVSTFATAQGQFRELVFAPSAASTAVPEPFTIIGTLVGGTAAIRLRKKLKSDKV